MNRAAALKSSLAYVATLFALTLGCVNIVRADYPAVITNKSLPKHMRTTARQCSPSGDKIVFSNLDLSSQGYVYCPEPPRRWAILDSNANELIAPELEPVVEPKSGAQAQPKLTSVNNDLSSKIPVASDHAVNSALKSFEKVAEALGN